MVTAVYSWLQLVTAVYSWLRLITFGYNNASRTPSSTMQNWAPEVMGEEGVEERIEAAVHIGQAVRGQLDVAVCGKLVGVNGWMVDGWGRDGWKMDGS